MASPVALIVGLGNPGDKYARTRHNAGFLFADEVVRRLGGSFKNDKRYFGDLATCSHGARKVWVLKPDTFMNRSGQAVAALANFYKIEPEQILIAHDELDIPPGDIRLKSGGGHGGHNGLRDSIAQLGNKEFIRLRIGIGHPGHSSEVSNYVLSRAAPDEQIEIERAVDRAIDELETILDGDLQKAMNRLHGKTG